LYHLDLGDHARALELYDTKVRPAHSSVALEMVDAAAMLWRLMLRGVDVGPRWQPLADAWQPLAQDGYYAFNDVHAVMALVGAGRWAEVDATLQSLRRAAVGEGTNAMMSREVGLPVARALAAFGRGQYDVTIDELLTARANVHRFGGSHAQRDIVHLTLVEAALRGGRAPLARALAAERTGVKRSSPFNWQLTARALATASLAEESLRAREMAASAAAAQRSCQNTARAAA
jgi:hypothetical protein